MAIALFSLCDGETIGSNLGRYGDSVGLGTTLMLRRRLFGHPCRPNAKLPGGVRHLAEETRDYWNLDAKEIIEGHTEFHYATLTLSEAQRNRMFLDMLDQPAGRCSRRSACGWMGERVTRFRYCEECLSAWRAKAIPPYWMVNHQLPGVYVCSQHSRMLRAVTTPPPSENIRDLTVVTLKESSDQEILTSASLTEWSAIEDVARRSAQYSAGSKTFPPATKYREWLQVAGFVWPNGRVDHHGLVASLLRHFGKEYCELAGLTRQRLTSWLRNIMDPARACEPGHPFLFIAIGSLLAQRCALPGSFVPAMPNGTAVLKMESSKSDEKKSDLNITELSCIGVLHRPNDRWRDCAREGNGWRLACSCGVSYQTSYALGARRAELAVEAYGVRYQNHICRMLANGVSVEDVSRELRLSVEALLRLAHWPGFAKHKALSQAEIQRMRDRWRSIVRSAPPEKRITSAYRVDSKLYRTLCRYDREWFSAFNLANRTPPKRSSFTDLGKNSTNH
ncbi:TnsD family Tn7-like transposition protein [Paraburkholderia sp. CNPSo 3076]|uniref:TnsD family Tn7-like transposition protein n=1 Tax=Paraburkholderia sp. CNPSo 3076 TaxID=2940936 RepID=UPI00225990C7|nr:TnsD family Tn7-like transposition protein [Paraburkholderia sp. CNPSo 3076]MCX5538073.1 TnsD family Tn7-like transposition protein [Paraburkholderia sp. CNPSo 3076]